MPLGSAQYEKPTGGGQSNITTEPSLVHACGFEKRVGTPVLLKPGVESEFSLRVRQRKTKSCFVYVCSLHLTLRYWIDYCVVRYVM